MTTKNYHLKCQCQLAELMRGFVPFTGIDYEKLMLVIMKKGDSIDEHKHAEHSCLFYPTDTEPVVVTPKAGMMIWLPPGTPHEVPRVTQDRVSVAMLVQDRYVGGRIDLDPDPWNGHNAATPSRGFSFTPDRLPTVQNEDRSALSDHHFVPFRDRDDLLGTCSIPGCTRTDAH